jgi:hypothetical protein
VDIQARYRDSIHWANDKAMVRVTKALYGIPQAGRLSQERLIPHLAKHGYALCKNTPCLFRHITRPVSFTLVVDDFGVAYALREDAEHLATTLRLLYKITTDWSGTKYVGLTIGFDRVARTVAISVPGYVSRALKRFGVVKLPHLTSTPLPFTAPSYGTGVQLVPPDDTSAPLTAAAATRLREIVGVFLFYAVSVDCTMLVALGRLASAQALPTEAILPDLAHFLQYAASWPDASVVFHASDMRLAVDSDASYLSEPRSRSRAGGRHYLTSTDGTLADNGPVDIVSAIIPSVVSSAFEAEYAALFLNGRTAEELRGTLEDLGWPQAATPITSDNSTAIGIGTRKSKQRRSKAIDMRYHWIRDRVDQNHFL